MKISICIPQYNRIQFLLKSLRIIEKQTYPNIEIVISDDCSTDETEQEILALMPTYKYPIIFDRNEKNMGYDRNYRKCIEMASGEYVFVIGNDDSINGEDSIAFLVAFLKDNDYPDVGFCNMVEERTANTLITRALNTSILGSGAEVALRYYSCFSFVGGLIYKRSTFLRYNTDKHDGSVYAQMYLGCLLIASGSILFSIKEPLVLKDILIDGNFRNSYRDRIAKKWKDYKKVNGGIPSVIHVLIESFKDAGVLNQAIIYRIFKRIYSITFPFWVLDYKGNHALPEAIGLIQGLYPPSVRDYGALTYLNRTKIFLLYCFSGLGGLLFPVGIFNRVKNKLYTRFK